jgi:hypothetical protein
MSRAGRGYSSAPRGSSCGRPQGPGPEHIAAWKGSKAQIIAKIEALPPLVAPRPTPEPTPAAAVEFLAEMGFVSARADTLARRGVRLCERAAPRASRPKESRSRISFGRLRLSPSSVVGPLPWQMAGDIRGALPRPTYFDESVVGFDPRWTRHSLLRLAERIPAKRPISGGDGPGASVRSPRPPRSFRKLSGRGRRSSFLGPSSRP